MAFRIPLQAIPNQAFSVLLDDITYRLTLKSTSGIMSVSIALDDTQVVSGSRFFTDTPLIPYAYLEGSGGNFIFTSEADELPNYESFAITQFLIYLTAADLADARS